MAVLFVCLIDLCSNVVWKLYHNFFLALITPNFLFRFEFLTKFCIIYYVWTNFVKPNNINTDTTLSVVIFNRDKERSLPFSLISYSLLYSYWAVLSIFPRSQSSLGEQLLTSRYYSSKFGFQFPIFSHLLN